MCISRPLKGAFKIQQKRAVPYANQHFGIYLGNVCRRNYLFRYPSIHQNSPVIIRSTAEFHKMLNLHQLSVDYEFCQNEQRSCMCESMKDGLIFAGLQLYFVTV